MLVIDALCHYAPAHYTEVQNTTALLAATQLVGSVMGHLTIEDLFDPKHAKAYAALRMEGRHFLRKGKAGPSTVRRELGVLTSALHFARKSRAYEGDIPVLWKPAAAAPRREWLLREQASAMLKDLADRSVRWPHRTRYRQAFIFMVIGLFCGARANAIYTLPWSRVHISNGGRANGFIDFRDPDRPVVRKRRAVVPISDELLPYIERFKAEATTEYVCIVPECVRDILIGSAKRCGVKNFHVHILRKSFATWAAQDRVDMAMIANALGDSVEQTMSAYAIFHPDYMDSLTKRPSLGPQPAYFGRPT